MNSFSCHFFIVSPAVGGFIFGWNAEAVNPSDSSIYATLKIALCTVAGPLLLLVIVGFGEVLRAIYLSWAHKA